MMRHVRKFIYLSAICLLAVSRLQAQEVDCSLGWRCEQPSCPGYECCKWWLRGDMLYWKARGSNINYVSSYERLVLQPQSLAQNETVAAAAAEQKIRVKSKSLNFDRDFGFRLGFGHKRPCSCWEFGFLWTHFYTKARGRPENERCLNAAVGEIEYDTETEWKLHLNFWDFDAVRSFCTTDCLTTKLLFGIRGARIKQDYCSCNEYFTDISSACVLVNVEDCYDIKEKHEFYGAGPRVGVAFDWCLGCGFSLYAQMEAAFLVGYSEHKVDDGIFLSQGGVVDIQRITALSSFGQIICEDTCVQANRVITDLAGGLRWNPCLRNCCYNLFLQLGWEYKTIFGQKNAHFGRNAIINDPYHTEFPIERATGPCKSTLSVYGLTFSVGLEF